MMRRAILAVVVIAVSCACWAAGSVAQDKRAAFSGLWQGVDNVDGSLRSVSISDVEGDGVWLVRAHDSFWSLCNGPHALEETTGSIEASGALRTKGTVRCIDGKHVSVVSTYTPQGNAPDGPILEHIVGKPFKNLLFRISR